MPDPDNAVKDILHKTGERFRDGTDAPEGKVSFMNRHSSRAAAQWPATSHEAAS